MRLFVACEVPAEVRQRLVEVRRASTDRAWRWVAEENIHLTLKFLGEVDEASLSTLEEALSATAREAEPFDIALGGLGVLPPRSRPPRVLYAGLGAGRAELGALARRLEAEVEPLGFPPERRPFTAHATLARVRRDSTPRDTAALLERFATSRHGAWSCSALTLHRSELRPGGAVYSVVRHFPFGG